MQINQYVKLLSELNIQSLFLYACPNKVHVLGLTQILEGDWAIVISLKRKEQLAIFLRESLSAQEVWEDSPFNVYIRTFSSLRDLVRKVGRFVRRGNIGVGLAWESEQIINQLRGEGAKIIDLSAQLLGIREKKTVDEQKIIRRAATITNQAFLNLIERMQESTKIFRETEIANILQTEMIRQGANRFAIPTSIVSELSPAPQNIWRSPRDKQILKGTLILLRFGAQISYYKSIVHRVILTQKESNDIILSYDIAEMVQTEHQNFLKNVRTERKVQELSKPIKRTYPGLLRSGEWITPIGHGIGLETVEYPLLSPKKGGKLKEDTIICAGKGFLIKDKIIVPVRDMILIKKSIEILTNSSSVTKL